MADGVRGAGLANFRSLRRKGLFGAGGEVVWKRRAGLQVVFSVDSRQNVTPYFRNRVELVPLI